MNKTDKTQLIEVLKEKFDSAQYFYIADSSTLTVGEVNNLRALCHQQGVEMKVVKNTLAQKALDSFGEEKNYGPLAEALKGPSTLFFADSGNAPAKLIKEYRGDGERPILKAAYIDSDIYLGDDQLDTLSSLKSKDELIGDVILLLQSPMKNLLGSLQSGQGTISGLLKALENRAEQ